MKVQTKIGAFAIAAASLGLTGTAYATSVAPEEVPNDQPAATPLSDAERAAVVEAKVGANRFAIVEWNGTLLRGKNAVSSSRVGSASGDYEVIFDRDITDCAYTATIDQTIVAEDGEITIEPRSGEPNGVFVTTSDSSGGQFDRRFHLVVTC